MPTHRTRRLLYAGTTEAVPWRLTQYGDIALPCLVTVGRRGEKCIFVENAREGRKSGKRRKTGKLAGSRPGLCHRATEVTVNPE